MSSDSTEARTHGLGASVVVTRTVLDGRLQRENASHTRACGKEAWTQPMGGDKDREEKSSRERRSRSRDEYRSRKRDRRSRSRDRKKRKKHRSSSRSRRSSRRRSRSRSHSESRSRSRRRRKHHRSRSKSEEKSSKRAPLSAVLPTLSEAPSIAQMMQMNPSCSLQEVMSKVQMNRNYSIPDVDAAAEEESDYVPKSAAQLRAAKELYVANIHPSVQSQQLQDFLGNIIQQVGLIGTPGNPIVSTWMSPEGNCAFCEFRTPEECTLALMLNGLSLMGQQLTCGRPKTYAGPAVRMPNITARTSTSLANLGCTTNLQWFTTGGAHSAPLPRNLTTAAKRPTALRLPEKATPNSILMTNLPTNLDSDQVEELVRPFGPIRFFILLEDECGESTGRAVFEFVDVSLVDTVVEGLNGLEISGEKIQLKRAPVKEKEKEIVPTRILRLSNMVTLEELKDDEEYQDIKDDIEEECQRYGPIVRIVIPRPDGTAPVDGLLQVFIEFESIESCKTAMKRCNGRTFGPNPISAVYYEETKFSMNELE